MIKVNSKVMINNMKIKELTRAQVISLEKTAEALHTEVVQAQVMPFDVPTESEKAHGKTTAGTLQNESTFVDYSGSRGGRVTFSSSSPYARRMYYHPEYNFDKGENPNAKGKWYDDWLPGGNKDGFAKKAFKEFYKRETGV